MDTPNDNNGNIDTIDKNSLSNNKIENINESNKNNDTILDMMEIIDDTNKNNDTILNMMEKIDAPVKPESVTHINRLPSEEFYNKLHRRENTTVIRSAPVTQLKTIKRRGNTYKVQSPRLPSDDSDPSDHQEASDLDVMMDDLYKETLAMSSSAMRKSSIFKFLYILSTFFMIIAGALIGILTLFSNQSCSTSNTTSSQSVPTIIAGSFGFTITAIQTLITVFSIEKRGVLLREISNRLRKISRQIKMLQHSDINYDSKFKRLDQLYTKIDDLDLCIFEGSITTYVSKGTNSSSDNSDKSTGSKNPKTNRLYDTVRRFK